MPVDYKLLGERIKRERLKKRITQKELAKELGVSVAFLSRIERGSSQVNLKRIIQIGDALGVSGGVLVSGVSEESKEYLTKEFAEILNQCDAEKQRAILDIAKLIISI